MIFIISGHVCLIKQSDSLAFLALYITSTPYRGRGIGHQVFQYALDMAGSKTVILDSVIGKPEVYAKSGFKLLDIDLIHIYGFVDDEKLVRRNDVDFTVDKVTPDNVADVIRFDQQVTLVSRADFLNTWLLSSTSVSLRAVNRAGEVIGYIVVRPDHVTKGPNSFKIGGFYANDVIVAHDLICCALGALPQASRVWVECPSTNEDLSLSMYKALGLEIVLDEWKLMKMAVGGKYPNLDWTKIFAVTNTSNTSI